MLEPEMEDDQLTGLYKFVRIACKTDDGLGLLVSRSLVVYQSLVTRLVIPV